MALWLPSQSSESAVSWTKSNRLFLIIIFMHLFFLSTRITSRSTMPTVRVFRFNHPVAGARITATNTHMANRAKGNYIQAAKSSFVWKPGQKTLMKFEELRPQHTSAVRLASKHILFSISKPTAVTARCAWLCRTATLHTTVLHPGSGCKFFFFVPPLLVQLFCTSADWRGK